MESQVEMIRGRVGWVARSPQYRMASHGRTEDEARFALSSLLDLVKRLNAQWEAQRDRLLSADD